METTTIVALRSTELAPIVGEADKEFAWLINELGVSIVEADIEDWGTFDARSNIIILRRGLGVVQRRSTLARMLGHAVCGHPFTSAGTEAEARVFAAQWMITPEQFAEAAKAVNWAGAIALELGVMPSDAVAYLLAMDPQDWAKMQTQLAMAPRGFEGIR